MAAEAPDPKTFGSWEEAFQYPIPAVRGMERQLRGDIDSNREKLRTLVGASYRDLLGTAESIIEMGGQMRDVETYIGEIGKRCNTRILEKKGSNMNSWAEEIGAPRHTRYAFASQLAVLRSCPDVISRLFKSGGSVLLAAKVLVISRLLHTKLSQRPNPPPYLDNLRNRLASLRRRLLGRIDRRFKSLETSRDVLVEAMCAFALATSSSPKDVIRHYHHIRLEAISENMDQGGDGHDSMLLALRLYVKTLKDTQAVIPAQLAHALEKLKSVSLFRSQDVYSLIELNLDVHERWIGDDIKIFTPYIRHDDLTKAETERSLKQWAKSAFGSFLAGLRNRIQDVEDPGRLMDLRRQVLELWLSNHQHSTGVDSAETLDGLRDVFNLQSIRLIQSRASKLDRVGSIVKDIMQNWHPGVSDLTPSLWDSSITSMEFENGGKPFRERLESRLTGKNEPLSRVSLEYGSFLESIEVLEEMIKQLRETRWADDVDDVDDEDDLLDNKQVLLSEDDPRLLQEELNSAVHEAYTELQIMLCKLPGKSETTSSGQQAAYLTRVWRELRQHLPKSYQNAKLGNSWIPSLQHTIADEALRVPLERCSKRIAKMSQAKLLQARPLWEGDPELPVLPSVWTYRFLLDLASSMNACGSDVWSPQAVNALKKELILSIAPMFEGHQAVQVNGHRDRNLLDGEDKEEEELEEEVKKDEEEIEERVREENGEVDGEEPGKKGDEEEAISEEKPEKPLNGTMSNGHVGPKPEDEPEDGKIQRFFDICYLTNASAVKEMETEENQLVSLQGALVQDLRLEPKSMERMKKDAAEYWKRTSLLFALLA